MDDNFGQEKRVALLVIEWDGDTPPTTWYNRIHKLGFWVRGDKEKSPLARRSGYSGFVHQEGALFCDSEDQARGLGHLAKSLGAKSVTIGSLETTVLSMSAEDEVSLNNIQHALGRRGRPEPDRTYVLTCQSCGKSQEYTGRPKPNCPYCGSFQVTLRVGNQQLVSLDPARSLADNWFYSRFVNGSYEKPLYNSEFVLPEFDPDTIGTDYRNTVAKLLKTTLAASILKALKADRITLAQACEYLDAGFLVLGRSDEKRLNDRIYAVTHWVKLGHDASDIPLSPIENEVDAFDIFAVSKSACLDLI